QIGIGDARAVELLDRKPVGLVEMVEQAGKQIGVRGRVHATFPEGRWPGNSAGWISKNAPKKATESVCMTNNGKSVAWVTGGGSGIGESGAEFLAADGWTVVVSGRRQAELDRVVAQIAKKGGKAEALVLDVSSKADVNKAAEAIVAKHGRIDLLVN